MNEKFDELAKGWAQSVTRRGALKRFGVGLAGVAIACFGLANKARADQCGGCPQGQRCRCTRYKVPCTTGDVCGHITICRCQ